MTIEPSMLWSLILTVVAMYGAARLRQSEAAKVRLEDTVSRLTSDVILVKAKMIEEAKVRAIVNESVAELKADQQETKRDVKALLADIHELTAMLANNNLNHR